MSNTINILAVGDVVSASGCEKLRNCLPKFKREKNIDVTVVNGENSAVGNGILPMSADDIFTKIGCNSLLHIGLFATNERHFDVRVTDG